MPELRIGISGWTYAPWRSVFYPKKLPHDRELEYASRQLNTIEINGSFYSLQRPESYQRWYSSTPEGFVFSVKGGRFITHMRKLRDVRAPVANFLASGPLALKEKLGPILWQFPATMKYDRGLFEDFLALLPRDTEAALALARRHDRKAEGRTFLESDRRRPLRHAIEVRHESFRDPGFVELLRKHGAALVFSHSSGAWPYFEDVTADFVYVRLHGEGELYSGGYGDRALDRWAERVRGWSAGKEPRDAERISSVRALPRARDVFVYFDNDAKVRAPFDALSLVERLGRPEQAGRAGA